MENKNKFNYRIEGILLHVAINLHRTKDVKNRVKALSIFEIIDSLYWLGYYHEHGYGGLEINDEKAMNYYKKSVYRENYYKKSVYGKNEINAMCRYAIYLIKTSEKKENREIKDKEIQSEITYLFRKAAILNNDDGRYYYGDIILNGKLGNEVNIIEGMRFIDQAVKNGHEKAKLLSKEIFENWDKLFINL
ncbi:8371_t:CDS:1 [Scutellospora calospora]|uniref:8371_t:CDS:1 n=1 Tax=Scutellospora calospora TaxID=85575 RepID=A0ACA9JZ88_9GLOM|nr:8371_t:CDS:1 [Scutellospora calospora]